MPATSGVPEENADSPPGSAADGARWRRVFPGDQPQLAVLRRWLYSLLPDCPARGDVVSVATELGTNAVLHTSTGRGGWFAVEVTWYGPVIRVAVADCGGSAEPHLVHDPAGEHGRGLALVQGLAARTGFLGDHHGRVVWADVPWGAPCKQPKPAPRRHAGWQPAHGSYQPERESLSA